MWLRRHDASEQRSEDCLRSLWRRIPEPGWELLGLRIGEEGRGSEPSGLPGVFAVLWV